MKTILISALLASTTFAGELNIVHLGPPDEVLIEITCDGAKQEVDLPHGGMTGQFILPEKEATIRLPGTDMPQLKIPANAIPHIAILSTATEGYRWLLIPGKPTNAKWAMRAINLTRETITLAQDEAPLEITPDSPTAIPVAGKAGMSVKIKDGDEFTYQGSEPSAVLALIHRKDDALHVLFVPDR